MKTSEEIGKLVNDLRSSDGVRRERSRRALIKFGRAAVRPLLDLLTDPEQRVRWEACMALRSIRDPVAAPALVKTLKDDSIEVRWLAAEALVAIGEKALIPLLKALELEFDSVYLREGASHILHVLERQKKLKGKTQRVLDALHYMAPKSAAGLASKEALDSMKKTVQ